MRNQPNIFIDPLGLVRCYLKHRSSAPFDLITRDTVSTSLGPIPMYDSSETVKCALELDLFKRSPIFGGPLSAAFCLLSGAKYADSAVRLALVTATVYSTSYSQWFTEEWCLDECSGEEKFRSVVASGVTRLSRPEVVSTHCRLGLEPVLRGAPNSFWSTGK